MTRHRILLAVAVLGVVVACRILQREVLEDLPHGWDALSYVYQAQVFASGHVVAPAMALEPYFFMPFVVEKEGRRFSIHPPGWPLVLGLFMALGLRSWASPVLAGACAALLWQLARRVCGVREGWVALALALASPFFMFMGTAGISHLPCATALLAMQLALLRALESGRGRACIAWGLLAGGAAAAAFLTRPYSAVLGMVASVWLAAWVRPASAGAWTRSLLAAAPTAGAGVLLLLVYNRLTTGSALVMGYYLFNPHFSFLGSMGPVRPSLWANFTANVPIFVEELNREIWGGFLPDLWLVAAVMILRPRRAVTWGLVGAAVIFICGHSLYYYFDLYFGPRAAFETLPWIVIASASGLVALLELVWTHVTTGALRLLVCGATLASNGWGALTLYPMLADYYGTNYCGQGGEVVRAVEAKHFQDAIVFVSSTNDFAFYNLMDRNAADPRQGRVVFASFMHGDPHRLLAVLPRREVWLLEVGYKALPSRNNYNDRFTITQLALHQ